LPSSELFLLSGVISQYFYPYTDVFEMVWIDGREGPIGSFCSHGGKTLTDCSTIIVWSRESILLYI
jgi:hypothetical protein